MEKKIKTFIYTLRGYKLVPEEKMLTKAELMKLKDEAHHLAVEHTDWSCITEGWNHIYYYGEIRDENDEITFANVYLNNYALQDYELNRIARNASYIGALHRR